MTVHRDKYHIFRENLLNQFFDLKSWYFFATVCKAFYSAQQKLALIQFKKRSACEEKHFSIISKRSVFFLLHNLDEIERSYPDNLINVIGKLTFTLIPVFNHLNEEREIGFYGTKICRGFLNGKPYLNLGYHSLIQSLLPNDHDNYIEKMRANLDSSKFWKVSDEWSHESFSFEPQRFLCTAMEVNHITSYIFQRTITPLSRILIVAANFKSEEVLNKLMKAKTKAELSLCTIL